MSRLSAGQRALRLLAVAAPALWLAGCVLSLPALERRLDRAPLSKQGQEYYLLVNRLKKGDFSSVDFNVLRLSWTHTPEYLAGSQVERTALADAYRHSQQAQYRQCLSRAGEALVFNYTSLAAHNWAAYCATQLGLSKEAVFHAQLLDRLLQTVLATGSGDSPEQAWQVTGPSELVGLIQLLGLEIRNIAPAEHGDSLMRLQVRDLLEKQHRVVWADYSIPLERHRSLRRELPASLSPASLPPASLPPASQPVVPTAAEKGDASGG